MEYLERQKPCRYKWFDIVNQIANTGKRKTELLFETLKSVFEDIFDIYHLQSIFYVLNIYA